MSSNESVGVTSSSSQSQAPATSSTDASSSPAATTTSPTSTSTTPAPATSAAATSTSQSSAAETSAAGVATTSSPTSVTTTAAPTTTSSFSFTTQVATTLYSTDPAGSIVYVTTTVPDVITSGVSSSTGSSSSTSHTGVIVGAVVGGVAGIILLTLLLFCIRKRVRKDEFDGNFDPDHIVGHSDGGGGGGGGTLPQVDLADEVTPFPQSYADQGNSSMRHYGDSPYATMSSSFAASGKASTDFYPPGTGAAVDAQPRPFMQPAAGPPPSGAYLPPINMYRTGPVDWHTPRPGVSPPPSTVSNNTTSTRGAKEREAVGRNGQGPGLGLATQQEAAEVNEDVVVHQDAGRAPVEEHAPPREIPPAYESIRQD